MWKPVSERPEIDHQPCRQFIRLEGTHYHSGLSWRRVWFGEAFIRRPGADGEMLQYRKSDIDRLCADGDMDPESAKVTHWMPAQFPSLDQ